MIGSDDSGGPSCKADHANTLYIEVVLHKYFHSEQTRSSSDRSDVGVHVVCDMLQSWHAQHNKRGFDIHWCDHNWRWGRGWRNLRDVGGVRHGCPSGNLRSW